MKRGAIIFFLSILCLSAVAEGKTTNFTFGTEWTYCATFLNGHRYYFLAPEGYRIEDIDARTGYATDGEVFLHAGYNLNPHWNLSFYIGYTGIGKFHNGIPMSLRATRYFGSDPANDRWFAFIDLGSGIALKDEVSELLTAKAGGGYRISLSRITKLDLVGSIRFMHTRPDVMYYGEKINSEDIATVSGYIMSASIGIGLTF